jgi:hypothetical protein
MKRYYTAKEKPMATIITQFPNDGTFQWPGSAGEMFFYMIEETGVRTKDVDERSKLAELIKEHDYIGVDVDHIAGKMLHLPVFEKKSTALDDYDRAMGIIGKR